ncbi:type I restriction endonuclease [Salipiger marinus]|uniref:Type I restriction enzyme R protein N terminus (HSDR_N) n=1 Tax=Salipiger marinus TaxID=555512 RepID=A0A1G8V7H1_9RHOB|nr:type I restriction endonuclease [Salipiger marinus]SDJ62032.1 Type I restriction enzyme R protein N terminus (HSDR_N) [Salipiger marinus]
MRTSFSPANTESDVEQFFVIPFLTGKQTLSIPDPAILTKPSLATLEIGKGKNKRRYVPDFLVYHEGLPSVVIEAKNPEETLETAINEAQLYALEINKNYPSGINPCEWAMATNGNDVWLAHWDSAEDIQKTATAGLVIGSSVLTSFAEAIGWGAISDRCAKTRRKLTPQDWTRPSESLGENRVNLAKAGHNSLYADLEPVLRKYFDPKDREVEDLIIERAYVSTDESTKYERSFEDFLRTRVIPLGDDRHSSEIATTRKDAGSFGKQLNRLAALRQPFMQLIIGGVGSGKTTFLKRFFKHLLPQEMKEKIVYCRINFNIAPDDVTHLENWVCEQFIYHIKKNYSIIIDTETEHGLQSVFSEEIKNNSGAYSFLKRSGEEKYLERIASDLLEWMSDPRSLSRALARSIGGDRGYLLIIAFDNVDRRERDVQLRIFQVGQWFMNHTKSVCVMTMRDETFEAYKDEKPLDAFLKTGNFYIRPPRFVDMVSKRLDLAISDMAGIAESTFTYEVDGLGAVKYPATAVGNYLTSIFVDLFKKRRNITTVLEGLSGRNARKSLEMFIATLTSAHFNTQQFSKSVWTMGSYSIHEAVLLKALMRTTYLYFTPSHGFVRNIYNFPLDSRQPDHFLKSEILDFLILNRKKVGDTRYEGYFTASRLAAEMGKFGYLLDDVMLSIDQLVLDELVITERQTRASVKPETAVRVHPSGYVHMKILASRSEYISSCALITPLRDTQVAQNIGAKWHINDPYTDIRKAAKEDVGYLFIKYLTEEQAGLASQAIGLRQDVQAGRQLLRLASDAIGYSFEGGSSATDHENEFGRLFE